MARQRRKVTFDKHFFLRERDQNYGSWMIAWWREQFQNSVDAGAKNIRIYLKEAEARGAFDEYRGSEPKTVVRVVFADDGCGMSRQVLESVYFRVGSSTKVGEEGKVGGFGRARMMTCFSQDRYSILTKNSFVMGRADDFDVFSLKEAVEELSALESNSVKNAPGVLADENSTRIGLLQDRQMIKSAIADGGYDGCRIEVDMETWKTPGYDGNRPTSLAKMEAALRQYLSESELKPSVFINDRSPETYFNVDAPLHMRTGRARKVLTTGTGAEEKAFAKVYVVKADDPDRYAKMIVRVDGAAMYSDPVYNLKGLDVVVEVKPRMSRKVLNSNRDGMHSEYSRVVGSFREQLAVENISALKDRQGKKHYTVEGQHGLLHSERKSLPALMAQSDEIDRTMKPHLAEPLARKKIGDVSQLRDANVSFDASRAFVKAVRYGESFLNSLRWNEETPEPVRLSIRTLISNLGEHQSVSDNPELALIESCPPELMPWLAGELAGRVEKAKQELKDAHVKRLANMHDTVICVERTNEKTKSSPRQYDPNNWSTETGKGKKQHALLAAWTASISLVLEALFEVRPAVEPIGWQAGFIFDVEDLTWQSDDTRPSRTEASHVLEDGMQPVHQFLINPVTDDGKPEYDLTKDDDVWRLISKAIHEVGHVLERQHDQRYATLQTHLTGKVFPPSAIKRVQQSAAAVLATYSGKTTVHALDIAEGPRPSERLRRLANGNRHEMSVEAVLNLRNG